ncbi:T9SS type A sorting domain-containing protein [Tamlana agarivorans]|uniref:T9SS type A sorting domain-containing protein n=1 Tax=Pseudotamlana agarivorans TaxID=481183 RepID=A0ACC5U7G8_9FLAO|nr:T9SS type A sorting domain-containing protein [Tamlana agarivorans]MBU2950262.1 T9SS type A sorting domain-containing protein [Tamlana agarivorans]
MKTKLQTSQIKWRTIKTTCALFLVGALGFAQTPVSTTNTEISGVTVAFYFNQQVDVSAGKLNYATNTVDGDIDTDWAGESAADMPNRGEALIFDLGGSYELAELQYLTVAKDPTYQFQIWVSTGTSNEADFINAFPTLGNLLSSTALEYKQFLLTTPLANVKYVMLKCYGRADSAWNTISELKFYEASTASVKENELSGFALYPNPANDSFSLNNLSNKVNKVDILNLQGQLVLSQTIESFTNELSISTTSLTNGIYLVKLSDGSGSLSASKKLIVKR